VAKLKIKGVLPPMITPFTEDGDVDYDAFQFNLEKWNKTDLTGFLVAGSNSETPYLTESEKLKMIELTVQTVDQGKLVLVGTGLESTRETIALTNKAACLGANAALLLTPSYYGDAMGDEAQLQYFNDVADNSDIPVMIYNVTKFTHINISPSVVAKLSRHPNILGMKDSSGNIAQLVKYQLSGLDPEFNLLVGTASAWNPALHIGIQASIMALANCCPEACVEVQTLFDENWLTESLELYKRLYPVNEAVTAQFGVPGLKYACDRLGFKGGYTRKPLFNLGKDQQKKIDKVLKDAQLI
jgi:4-hydroxy-2-oxoglutarate aldolase